MKKRSQDIFLKIGAFSMIILMCLAPFVPMAGGFLQQYHRRIRQREIHASKKNAMPIQIVLENSALPDCFFTKNKELVFDGLRYDVISMHQEGSRTVFKAIPDVKETKICSLTLRSILFPHTETVLKSNFTQLNYLPNPDTMLHLPTGARIAAAVFWVENAGLLEGYEWMFAPPPDRV